MVLRKFIPGSEWLYFKIYTGVKTADELLIRILYSFMCELIEEKLIDKYFFIRYSDPKFHIRFRIHIPDSKNFSEIFQRFYAIFQPEVIGGIVSCVKCDTYERELERYGLESMELSEKLFHVDSHAVLNILITLSNMPLDLRDRIRWQVTILMFDDLLNSFGYTLDQKISITSRLTDSFKQEFGFTKHQYTKQLNDKYRLYKEEIDGLMTTRSSLGALDRILQNRSKLIAVNAAQIIELYDSGKTLPDLGRLISAYQHMTMNRMFRSQNRLHELVVYDFINKYYKSLQAKSTLMQ